ncbi:MAG: LPS export ABC transporter permease LptF [Chromatiales bacterium]|nr:LPS export ABC transporter permease LptF [Gammaproteobacteria bacterium]MCP5351711.1 LPS export ABC transporter permease LptF [Chromatiales bacterium]
MFQVLDRYIIRETLQTWLAVTLVLMLILLSNRLARYLAEAVAGEIDGGLVFHLLALKAISFLSLLAPMSLYLAIMLMFGRLYRDSEMSALAACGVGPARLYRSLFLVATPVTALVIVLSFWVGPWASAKGDEVRALAENASDSTSLSPGRFRETTDRRGIMYVEKVNQSAGQIENVFIQLVRRGKPMMLASASATQWIDPLTKDRFVIFKDGYRYEGEPSEDGFKIIHFKEHAVLLREADPLLNMKQVRSSIPTSELFASERPEWIAELHWRFASPISVLLLTLLALPLAKANPRQGRYGKVVVAILIYIVYSNVMGVARVWIENGKLPDSVGLWWVHGLVLATAVFLLIRMHGWRWARLAFARQRADVSTASLAGHG